MKFLAISFCFSCFFLLFFLIGMSKLSIFLSIDLPSRSASLDSSLLMAYLNAQSVPSSSSSGGPGHSAIQNSNHCVRHWVHCRFIFFLPLRFCYRSPLLSSTCRQPFAYASSCLRFRLYFMPSINYWIVQWKRSRTKNKGLSMLQSK